MQNEEIVHVLYVARGRLSASEYTTMQTALNDVQLNVDPRGSSPWVCTLVTSQKAAILAARQQAPDIIVVESPQTSGRLDFCANLIHRWPSVRLVAATNDSVDKSPIEFERRLPLPLTVAALQNTLAEMLHTANNGYLVQVGSVRLDLLNRTVITPKGLHHMTPKQCALLHILMARRNEVVSRRELMQEIWQTTFLGDTRTLDVHIRWLREHIEVDPSNPRYLVTVRGKGYRFCAD